MDRHFKHSIYQELLTVVEEDLEGVESVLAMAHDEATHSESRAEGKYDTRATEASYLARGQAERAGALRRDRVWLQTRLRVQGQDDAWLIQLVGAGHKRWILVAPVCGGRTVVHLEQTVVVVTPQSPLGSELGDVEPGDEVELRRGERVISMMVERVL